MEGDAAKPEAIAAWNHFNPLPPHGGRLAATAISTMPSIFQSTPSAWRETTKNKRTRNILKNFNPLPPHGGRRAYWYSYAQSVDISIHSLRMEGDVVLVNSGAVAFAFQSTPSAWRETFFALPTTFHPFKFQSTPSAWRETCCTTPVQKQSGHFNPLPPHGGRRVSRIFQVLMIYFNPLPPHGGRQAPVRLLIRQGRYFNPLPPHGGRRLRVRHGILTWLFQSTPSAWRETRGGCCYYDTT